MDEYAHRIAGKRLSSFFFWWTSITDAKQLAEVFVQRHVKYVISCVTSCVMKCGVETRPARRGFVPAKSLLTCDAKQKTYLYG